MLVLDIETYKNKDADPDYFAYKMGNISAPVTWKDPVKIARYVSEKRAAAEEKAALDARIGMVVLIGMLSDKKINDNFTLNKTTGFYEAQLGCYDDCNLEATEISIIQQFWLTLHSCMFKGDRLITYNGKGFDLPFIFKRSLICEIPPPGKFPLGKYFNKYNEQFHVDLFNIFGEGSLAEWSYLLGQSLIIEKDGGSIGKWIEKKEFGKVKEKNLMDIYQTAYIYQNIERYWQ